MLGIRDFEVTGCMQSGTGMILLGPTSAIRGRLDAVRDLAKCCLGTVILYVMWAWLDAIRGVGKMQSGAGNKPSRA